MTRGKQPDQKEPHVTVPLIRYSTPPPLRFLLRYILRNLCGVTPTVHKYVMLGSEKAYRKLASINKYKTFHSIVQYVL
jgi:hypothetical protein